MELQIDWIGPTAFICVVVWLFSCALWDFILATIKTYERMRNGDASVFDLKREVQCFVLMCAVTVWCFYLSYRWLPEADPVTWFIADAGLLVAAVWLSRILDKKWQLTVWEPSRTADQEPKTIGNSQSSPHEIR